MPWYDHDEPVPQRPAPVQVPFLMRGRRLQAFIAVVGVVVVAAVSVAVARMGGDSGSTDLRADRQRVTTAGAADAVPVTSAPPEPATTSPAAPPTSSPSDGSAGQTPGGTSSPAPGDPGGANAVRPDTCGPFEVLVTVTPDQSTYARGEDVIVTATARNQSSRLCAPRDPDVEIRDETGALAVRVGSADFTSPPVPWPPGAELVKPFTWSRTICTDAGCQRATPGAYTATAFFGEYRSAPVTFTLL